MQTCRKCKEELSLSSFKLKKDGSYTTGCETCRMKDKIKGQERRAKNKQQSIPEGSSNCIGCLKILPLDNFKVSKAGKPLKNCIRCVDKRKKNIEEKEYDPETSKICKRCKRVVLLENFKTYRGKTTLQCNDCIASGVKAREKDKKKFAEMKVEEGHKFCLGCRKVLPLDQYNERTTGGLMAKCRTCNTEQLEYLHQHKCPHGKVNKSACKECGGTSICEHGRTRTYCKECGGGSLCEHGKRKDRCADCAPLYGRHQYCEHGSFKNTCVTCKGGGICEHETRRNRCRYCDFGGFLISRVRSAISGALESNKSKRTLDYLCCDIISYRKYLEDLMVDCMTWENYGTVWDIDHIVPLKYQNPTLEEIIERLHYTNTQPLWKRDNIVKGNKYISWLQQEAP